MSEASNNLLYKEAINWLYDMGCDEVVTESVRNFHGLRENEDNKIVFHKEGSSIKSLNLMNIMTIKELESYVKSYIVEYHNFSDSKFIFSDGDDNADLMVIGDKPESANVKVGRPFQGESGDLLHAMLKAINYNKTNTFYTNINFYDSSIKFENSLLIVKKIISIVKPKVIIMFGAEATKALTNKDKGIFHTRGKWFDIEILDYNIVISGISMFHPRYVLMHPESKKESWVDLKSVRQKLS